MVTEKMTVHKALTELKTIGERIDKEIMEATFVVANKHSNQKYLGVTIADYCEDVKAKYNKITDLIRRRNAIKRAVVQSNATTKVMIGGTVYTVAEAIDMKNNGMLHTAGLMHRLASQLLVAKREIQTANGDRLENRADDYIKSLYGNTDMKNLADDAQRMRKDFIASQTMELLDPINSEAEIQKMRTDMDAFMVEVDSALSVSNALTEIEVSY